MVDRLRHVPWRSVVALAMIVTGGGYLWLHRDEVADLILRGDASTLPLSLLMVVIGTVLGGLSWRRVMAALGLNVGRPAALALFLSSQIGKYLPGGVGPVVVQMAWMRSLGATPALVMRSYLLSLGVSSAAGLTVGALMMTLRWSLGGGCLAGAGALLSALLLSRRGAALLDVVLVRVPKARGLTIPVGTDWVRAYLLAAVGWSLLGLHVGILLGGTPGDNIAVAGAGVCATVAGSFAVVLPGGLGAREGALYWFLARTGMAGPVLVTLALSSRVVTLLVDVVLGLAATLVLMRLGKRRAMAVAPSRRV